MIEDILETWRVHDEINWFLLEAIPDAAFEAMTLLKNGKPSTGRNVSRVFAHLHAVRLYHLKSEFKKGLTSFETGVTPTRADLLEAFKSSSAAVERQLANSAENPARLKHRPALVLFGYLISHESHHRGQILLALKQSGIRMPDEAKFGIWEHWFRPKLKV